MLAATSVMEEYFMIFTFLRVMKVLFLDGLTFTRTMLVTMKSLTVM